MDYIYFDNAATSWPKPDAMIRAMVDFNANTGANPGRSAHRLSIESARIVYNTREAVSKIIGAENPNTVVFTRNATEGINTILKGILKPQDHVVTSSMEHNSVMRPLRALEKEGVQLSVVRCSSTGELDPSDIVSAIRKNTRLVIITHASNVTGTILPITEVANKTREHGVILCVDAAQTTGSVPINVIKDNIDILIFTGHKSLYGPQGTGGFYICEGLEKIVTPLEQGGTGSKSEFEEHPDFMPDRFESGTPNTIGIAGLGAGCNYVTITGVGNIHKKEMELTELFLDGISKIEGVRIFGNMETEKRIAVISFVIDGMSPSDISYLLDKRFNIMSRPGLHCAPSAHRTIGTFPHGTVRFSFGIFTTEDEIMTAIKAIETIADENQR